MKTIKFSKAANEHKHAIAELLYSDDKAFVPLTPMLLFDNSEFYYATASDAPDDIRACSSYQLWLEGLETPDFDERLKIPVYELSSSLVRSPLGGFGAYGPSLQELFMFIRILAIAGYLDKDDPLSRVCVLSAVVSKNEKSLAGKGPRRGDGGDGLSAVDALRAPHLVPEIFRGGSRYRRGGALFLLHGTDIADVPRGSSGVSRRENAPRPRRQGRRRERRVFGRVRYSRNKEYSSRHRLLCRPREKHRHAELRPAAKIRRAGRARL